MKIGILTYHRTLNYGACLQAIATRVILEKMGHQAFYVDYWPKYHQNIYKAFSFDKFWSLTSFRWKMRYLISVVYRAKRNNKFKEFLNKYIISYSKSPNEKFDVIIYGSDQIWRKQKALNDYNPIYFAQNNFFAHKHVAFSASMGLLPDSDIEKEKIKSLLGRFNSISVREKDLKKLLESMGVSPVLQTLDPTLLIQAEEWNTIIPTDPYSGPKYVLVYGIARQTPFNMESVKKYACEKGCIIKNLYGTADKADKENEIYSANPYEFISLIKNAECIFTSSFHGLAFSIIFEKEFFSSYKNNSNRAQTLLESLDLKDRLLICNQPIPQQISPINYNEVNKKKDQLINNTIDYMIHSL